ncbi:MAG: helix-turn-helix transcriptional regulator [Ectothiorhodospiraceae bacterium AqS1]|nr:helix-turn-helix transcriptional regulator [Ectothiorhodospiraceae bacterium AqS1]
MSNDQANTNLFPARLRETRNLRGLDQAKLSQLAGIPATSISHFESGSRKPSLDNLRKLADALRVSIDYLLGRTDNLSAHIDAAAYRHEDQMSREDLELMEAIRQHLASRSKSDRP